MPRQERKDKAKRPISYKLKAGAGIGGAIVSIVIVILLLPGTSPFFLPESSQPPPLDFGEGEGRPLVYDPVWNPCLEDWRPDYGLDCSTQKQVFGKLLKAPADLSDRAEQVWFNEVSLERLMRESPYSDAREYWLQPEFWPSWNETRLQQVLWPPKPQWTVFGYKFYTIAKGITIGQDAINLGYTEMRILLRPHWGGDLWQGFHLYPVYPETAMKQDGTPMLDKPKDGNPITQNPDNIPFRVSIETPSDEMYLDMLKTGIANDRREGGQFYVLPPNHPGFPANWARMITLRITFLSKNPEPGIWFFALHTANPSAEINEEYSFQYGLYYESAGEWPVSPIAPLFQGFVVVG